MGSVAIQNSYSLSNVERIAKLASKGGTTEMRYGFLKKGMLKQLLLNL
jgi:hypothetical protein